MFYFEHWYYLLLLLVIPVLIYRYIKKDTKNKSAIRFPSISNLKKAGWKPEDWKNHVLYGAKLFAVVLLILALARPREANTEREMTTEGIDIMLVMDISSSMKALDFNPNRLEAAKQVASQFIQGRKSDRIGLIVFAAKSFLQCPLTVDYNVLQNLMDKVDIAEKKFDGTAIGMSIANGINRLKDSNGESQVMILLSDGRNNAGEISPTTATQMAQEYGIKIYTIGIGKRGKAKYPVKQIGDRTITRRINVKIDEKNLRNIAQSTGGQYFRATDKQSLKRIYEEISQMEKTEVKVNKYYNYQERYAWFLFPGLLLLIISAGLEFTFWRRLP